jgi:hypothetical protein
VLLVLLVGANCNVLFRQSGDVDAEIGSGDAKSVDASCPTNDVDCDGKLNDDDNCRTVANVDQGNEDGDMLGDLCDNCVGVSNTVQGDADNDGIGDLCDVAPTTKNTVLSKYFVDDGLPPNTVMFDANSNDWTVTRNSAMYVKTAPSPSRVFLSAAVNTDSFWIEAGLRDLGTAENFGVVALWPSAQLTLDCFNSRNGAGQESVRMFINDNEYVAAPPKDNVSGPLRRVTMTVTRKNSTTISVACQVVSESDTLMIGPVERANVTGSARVGIVSRDRSGTASYAVVYH